MNQIKKDWKRAVIKVGSALIAPDGKGCTTRYILTLADFIHDCLAQGKEIVLVSSGGVAAGAGITNIDLSKPLSIPQKQALAAIGQSQVMQHWQRLFDYTCAQMLLTQSDLDSKKRLINARNTIETLFEMRALPIINENDSIAIDELVVGNNDSLAAEVAVMCDADLLIICSDVDGLYDKNPEKYPDAELIRQVETITDEVMGFAGETNNPIATGGMLTKLQAAKIATSEGIDTLIVNGRKAKTFDQLKGKLLPGTVFLAESAKESNFQSRVDDKSAFQTENITTESGYLR